MSPYRKPDLKQIEDTFPKKPFKMPSLPKPGPKSYLALSCVFFLACGWCYDYVPTLGMSHATIGVTAGLGIMSFVRACVAAGL